MKKCLGTFVLLVILIGTSACAPQFKIISNECDWYQPVGKHLEIEGSEIPQGLNRRALKAIVENEKGFTEECK